MPLNRFYKNGDLKVGSLLVIDDKEFHHITNVARKKPGDRIEIINGRGKLGIAKIESIGKKSLNVALKEVYESPPPAPSIILAQSLPRMNRLYAILEKGTELGVSRFILFSTGLKPLNKERLRAITISAIKQCGRLRLPKIEIAPPLKMWGSIAQPAFFGDLSPNAPSLSEVWPTYDYKSFTFFVGPESGFEAEEIKTLKDLGTIGVSLHKNILRTDTAAITALALISHLIDRQPEN